VTTAEGSAPSTRPSPWRLAAYLATEIAGTPPSGPARIVAETLLAVLRWAHRAPAPNPPSTALHNVLPALAAVLDRGVPGVINRGDLFVNEVTLSGPPRGMVTYARPVWRRARTDDLIVRQLRAALRAGARHSADADALPAVSRASSAFRGRPLSGASPLTPTVRPQSTARSPRRGR
jgi:hypothetical protein